MMNAKLKSCTLALVAGAVLALSANARASIVTINATDSGWYTSSSHNSQNKNYAAGSTDAYRNYFVFDLSSIVGHINGATLRLNSAQVTGTPDLEFYDVTTSIGTLTASQTGTTASTIRTDLGSGVFYGGGTVTAGYTDYNFSLNAAALGSLNTASGLWAVGGRNSDLNSSAFYGSGAGLTRQLVLDVGPATSVPEPATLALLGFGLLGLALSRREKR